MKQFTLLCALGLLMSSNAFAGWQLVKETREYILYVDLDAAEKNGALVRLDSSQDFHKMQTLGEHQYLSSKSTTEFDCEKTLMRQIAFSIFPENMANGGALVSEDQPRLEWVPLQKGSAAESVWQKACGKN